MKKLLVDFLKVLMQPPAAFVLGKFKPEIIGITGSAGKTTTKEAIFFVLKKRFGQNVQRSQGNLNTRLGLPLAILGFEKNPPIYLWPLVVIYSYIKAPFIRQYPKILVLEYAIDYPRELKILTRLTQPKIAVITTIGASHLQFFKSEEAVFQEKSELVKALKKDGWAVLNKEDMLARKMSKLTGAKIIYFGGENALNQAKEAAVEVANIYGISKEESKKNLLDFKMPEHRLEIKPGIKNTTIIDDTYNANPVSIKMALKHFANMPGKRNVIFLGDMLELGEREIEYHKEIGRLARDNSDVLVGVGKLAKYYNGDFWFSDSDEAKESALKIIKDNDIILIKGSRAVNMEKIVDRLIRNNRKNN